jgi:hypothetical protein
MRRVLEWALLAGKDYLVSTSSFRRYAILRGAPTPVGNGVVVVTVRRGAAIRCL